MPDGKRTPGPYDENNPSPLYLSHKRGFDELRRRFDAAWKEHERDIANAAVEWARQG